ncbi:MAG: hypothetical protein ACFB51_01190 [Anaerolineae bacterium]
MPYFTVRRHAELPAVITWLSAEYNTREYYPAYDAALRGLLDSLEEPVHLITDTRQLTMNFADLVRGLANTSTGSDPLTRHPMIRQIMVVTTDPLIDFGAKALEREEYGHVKVAVVATLEDAFAAIRGAAQ